MEEQKHIKGGGIEVVDGFKYSGKRRLDLRQECQSVAELKATDETSIPDGFTKYVYDEDAWYRYHSDYEYKADTGRWRMLAEFTGGYVLSEEWLYAITDNRGNLLWGIRRDGSCYQPKGIPEEVQKRFDELAGWQIIDSDEWLFGIVDASGNLLLSIDRQGHAVVSNGLSIDGHDGGLHIVRDENYLYAITDSAGTLLFGIDRSGRVVYNKGMSDEVRLRLDELSGYQIVDDETYVFAIADAADRILFGIRADGTVYIGRGVIEVLTWEEYQERPQGDDTIYIIREPMTGRLEGAFIHGQPLPAGEACAYLIQDTNVLVYRGASSRLPRFWIDHEEMTLNVEYPSGYTGPKFEMVENMLFAL